MCVLYDDCTPCSDESNPASSLSIGVMHMFGNFMTLAEKSIHNFSPL